MRRTIERHLGERVLAALGHARVVGVIGPRQGGKSTLAQLIVEVTRDARYVTLDNLSVRTEAERDPHGFVADRPGLLVIDEVQRVPELLLAIKAEVDRDDRPGRFLITGSSQLSANKGVTETLAGRIVRFELWPMSQGELAGTREQFVDAVFQDGPAPEGGSDLVKRDYLRRATAGGYPEALRLDGVHRDDWFDSYVETVVEREAPAISASPRTAELPRLVRLVAARHGGLLNVADLARDAALPERTVYRYLETLEAVFLVRRVPAWTANLSSRETRAAKIYLTDPGLAAHLRGVDLETLATPELALGADGPVIEGFVVCELLRQSSWSRSRPSLMHYRERNGSEIDIIVENRRRQLVGIEVKSAADVSGRDVRPLTQLRDRIGDRFVAGIILYCGSEMLRLGDRIRGLPISSLWTPAE
ncbi:MAG: ATP-binding protein [Pseudonocardiaceae bacterium]